MKEGENMARVRLVNLTKRYGKVVAVNDVNLEIEDKEFVALLGPSGCGKTTTLRMIAGLEKPTYGEIYFDDRLVNDVPPEKRNVAMVFQVPTLYPFMKVFDNIAFCLRNKKLPDNIVREKTIKAASLLKIEHLLDRMPHQLSGGEQQRVCIARAIVRDPAVFLMDEPLANLDARLREVARSEFKKLHEEVRGTFIYVTHDQVEAMTMADKIAVMKDGSIQQFGTPEEIYNNPINEFVATFVGSPPMNIIHGVLERRQSDLVFKCEYFTITLPGEVKEKLLTKIREGEVRDVKLGVRPSNLLIKEDGEIEATVYTIELMGEEKKITLKCGEDLLSCLVSSEFDVRVGERVRVCFGDKIFIFDAETGKNLLFD
jgi:multiple sugar transport system ATP-binding protein